MRIQDDVMWFKFLCVCYTQCDHFQQFYNRHDVKVHVSIIRWLHCAIAKEICYQKISAIYHAVHTSVQANFAM